MSLPQAFRHVCTDADEFLRALYVYKREGGLAAMAIRRCGNLLVLPVIGSIVVVLIGFFDWHALARCPNLDTCGTLVDYVQPLFHPPSPRQVVALLQAAFLCLWWLGCVVALPAQLRTARRLKHFTHHVLGLRGAALVDASWTDVVERLQQLAESSSTSSSLLFHQRLTRRDNYWTAIHALGLLRSWTVCGVALSDTLVLHHLLDVCVVSRPLSPEFAVHGQFPDIVSMRRHLQLAASAMLVAMPLMLPFLAVYFFFKLAEEFYSRRMYLGPRSFSTSSKWRCREFNEPLHALDQRLGRAAEHASDYLAFFVHPVTHAVASLVVSVSGFVLGVLMFIALVDESILLNVLLADHNLLWFLGVLTAVSTISRSGIPRAGKDVLSDAPSAFAKLAACTHYYPRAWKNREHCLAVRDEVARMYPYKLRIVLGELAGIVLVPVFVLLCMRQYHVLAFREALQNMTRASDVGYVCVYSCFRPSVTEGESFHGAYDDDDEDDHDNEDVAYDVDVEDVMPMLPTGTARQRRLSLSDDGQDKMARSMMHYRLSTGDSSLQARHQVEQLLQQAQAEYLQACRDGLVQPWSRLDRTALHRQVDTNDAWFYWLERAASSTRRVMPSV